MNDVSQAQASSNALTLALFARRMDAVCEEMGATLRQAAFSPNIRDRLDFSCALFDADGKLFAQAAHIPVHLGSMAYAMADVVDAVAWSGGDMLVFNDPFKGGTHLPDVTMVSPVFIDNELVAFVANRAHHADIGTSMPGSMPISRCLADEGVLIEPTKWLVSGVDHEAAQQQVFQQLNHSKGARGDFSAQAAANRVGVRRLQQRVAELGVEVFCALTADLNDYAARLAATAMKRIPNGEYCFDDLLDDDGQGAVNLKIVVTIRVNNGDVLVDFTGSDEQVAGSINCPLSVTAAAVIYVFRCLMPGHTPGCAGAFQNIQIIAPSGSLLNAKPGAAVAAGNVETSSRVADVVLGALATALPNEIPAASQGTMNNIAMGSYSSQGRWDYYETIGGGMGAGKLFHGLSGVQTHMTNTLNTPVEVLESCYPLRIEEYAIREGSGGAGLHRGGDGVIRQYRFLQDARVTLLTERRSQCPWGENGGAPGAMGINLVNGHLVAGKISVVLKRGGLVSIQTPGGGGWGVVDSGTLCKK